VYEKLGIGWGMSLFGFVSLALLPVPWLFYKFGILLRQRSAYTEMSAK
jgi:hypothetical protein